MRRSLGRIDERGLSLVEILVAVGLSIVLTGAALVQYGAARRALERGHARAGLQQALRVGFDRLTTDLRLAGLAVHPDDHASRPDEGIEAAFAGALVIRADFDGHTVEANDPEERLAAGGPFPTVTTGNDEIVAWVLAKADGSSPDTLTFHADVENEPRDGIVEPVTIGGVALSQDDPPYTLYRVHLRPASRRAARRGHR